MLEVKLDEGTAARRRVPIYLVGSDDGLAETGVTSPTIELSKNGAAQAAGTGSWNEIGDGQYYYEFAAGEVDTVGWVAGSVRKTGVTDVAFLVYIRTWDPYATAQVVASSIASGGIAASSFAANAIDAAALAADAVTEIQNGLATAAALDVVDNFLDTEVAAILAAVDTEIAAIKAITDLLTLTAIADAVLDRGLGAAAGASTDTTRSVRNALRALVNRVRVSGGNLEVYMEDDTTVARTGPVTSAAGDPVTEFNPT